MSAPELRAALIRAVHERFGLVFSPARVSGFERSVEKVAAAVANGSLAMLLAKLQQEDPAVLAALADELTISETYFFRDAQGFFLIDEAVTRAAAAGRTARFWSAGCSSGEEAYSLAIRALIARGNSDVPLEVIGTDLSPRALESAERAAYRPWSFRGVSDEVRERWFERVDGSSVRPIAAVRALVRFEALNLLRANDAPSGIDVTLCRNVLIYFDAPTIACVLEPLIRSLRPDGALLLGPSDPLVHDRRLGLEQSHGCVAYRRAGENLQRPIEPEARADSFPPMLSPRRSAAPKPPLEQTLGSSAPMKLPVAELVRRGRALADAGDLRAAFALLEEAGDDESALLLRAFVTLGLGDAAAALRASRTLTQKPSAPALAHVIDAMASVDAGDVEGARSAIDEARAALTPLPPETDIGNGTIAADALKALAGLSSRIGLSGARRRRRA